MSIYGSDWSTFDPTTGAPSLNPAGALIEGPRVVLERCAKRLTTQKGALVGAESFGLDLMTYAGKRLTPIARARIRAEVEAELARDEAVQRARVVSIDEGSAGSFVMRIQIELATGTFSLVLAAPQLTVEILDQDQG